MKRTVRVVLLGTMLQGGASAAEQNVNANPSLDKGQGKVAAVRQDAPAAKKPKSIRGKKPGTAAKSPNPAKDDSLAKEKQEGETGNPADQVEQSVQLKGVRG
ncbi:MAG: hypothetical protein HY799_11065 [Nitrosomonadales bacterium]|nr:hypothetical protein [Nitrosomonadales bacterium]